ncbi:hypothetical protein D9M71_548460 [compost metagenome]
MGNGFIGIHRVASVAVGALDDRLHVEVRAGVGQWLAPQVRIEGEGPLGGDRVDRRPPVGLAVEVGTPGVAVEGDGRRGSCAWHGFAGVLMGLEAQVQAVASQPLGSESQPLQQSPPKLLHLGRTGELLLALGKALGLPRMGKMQVDFLRIVRVQACLQQLAGESNQRAHGRLAGEAQDVPGVDARLETARVEGRGERAVHGTPS